MLLVALVAAVLLFDTVGSANCGELCYNNGPYVRPSRGARRALEQ